jgi:transposase-like protein
MYTIKGKCGSIHGREKNNFFDIRMKIEAEIVNGICPTCDEYTPLVGLTKQFYRCMTCGSDLEQKVNGVISYIPHLHKHTLQSEVDKYFDGKES